MYTTQGLMTAADLADHHRMHDTGTTLVPLDDVPAQLAAAVVGGCPVCDVPVVEHDAVTVQDASGEIVACLPTAADGWQSLPIDPEPWSYYA